MQPKEKYKTVLLFKGLMKQGVTYRQECRMDVLILSITCIRETDTPIHVRLIVEAKEELQEGSFDALRETNLRESIRLLPFTAYIKDKNVLWLNYYENPIPAYAMQMVEIELTPVRDVNVEIYQTFLQWHGGF